MVSPALMDGLDGVFSLFALLASIFACLSIAGGLLALVISSFDGGVPAGLAAIWGLGVSIAMGALPWSAFVVVLYVAYGFSGVGEFFKSALFLLPATLVAAFLILVSLLPLLPSLFVGASESSPVKWLISLVGVPVAWILATWSKGILFFMMPAVAWFGGFLGAWSLVQASASGPGMVFSAFVLPFMEEDLQERRYLEDRGLGSSAANHLASLLVPSEASTDAGRAPAQGAGLVASSVRVERILACRGTVAVPEAMVRMPQNMQRAFGADEACDDWFVLPQTRHGLMFFEFSPEGMERGRVEWTDEMSRSMVYDLFEEMTGSTGSLDSCSPVRIGTRRWMRAVGSAPVPDGVEISGGGGRIRFVGVYLSLGPESVFLASADSVLSGGQSDLEEILASFELR
jgi:hypothetical protein